MAIPTSKPLSLSTVQTEYGGSNPISMSEYRGKGNAPASGPIDLWGDFNGTSNLQTYNQDSFADEYTLTTGTLGDSTSLLQSKISNQSYASGQQYADSSPPQFYARNSSLASTLSGKTIQTVRTATINSIGRCDDGGSDYGEIQFRPFRYNGSFIDLGYPTQSTGNPGSTTGSLIQVSKSYDALANMSTADLHNFIKEGCVSRLSWVCPLDDSGLGTRNDAQFCGYWVELDFDYA